MNKYLTPPPTTSKKKKSNVLLKNYALNESKKYHHPIMIFLNDCDLTFFGVGGSYLRLKPHL